MRLSRCVCLIALVTPGLIHADVARGQFACTICPAGQDDDMDGVCNDVDICPGFHDNGPDDDGDGLPDACYTNQGSFSSCIVNTGYCDCPLGRYIGQSYCSGHGTCSAVSGGTCVCDGD